MALSLAEERFPILKRLLVCFSLANLFFVSAWYRIQDVQAPFANYFRAYSPDLTVLKATILATLLVTAVFAALSLIASRFPKLERLSDCLFLLGIGIGLEVARTNWPDNSLVDHLRNGGAICAEAAVAFGLLLRAFADKKVMVGAATRILLLFNFLFLALAVHFVSSWAATPPANEFADDKLASPSGKKGPRVLWMLFDSLDERMIFDARHPSLQLPELDRFRAHALWATTAFPPARFTAYSVPALLSGRLFQEASPAGPDQLLLTPRGGGPPVSWSAIPTIFFDVRKLGLDTRVTGWYHPYCRVFGQELVECSSELGVDSRDTQESYAASLGLGGAIRFALTQRYDDLRSALHLTNGRPSDALAQSYAQKRHQEQFVAIRKRTLETLPRFSSGLYYVHWPIPHPPGIYNRRKGQLELDLNNTFLDNLALVDKTLGELRTAMEAQGTWEDTTIILTADHGYRPEVWKGTVGINQEMIDAMGNSKSLRVPVLVRFPHQAEMVRYSESFNNVLLHDLTLAVLRGEINTAEQASRWLDANRDRFPTSPPQPIP